MKLLLGNCLDTLKDFPDNSVHSIVTDPPYGFSFMGKKWDYDVPSVEIWKECLRVLKPGGHLIVDVPQTFHYYTVGKKILIAMGRWFAGWETQFTPAQLERVGQEAGGELVRTYGDWMVPGLWYRAIRKMLVARLGIRLPMYPRGLPLGWLRKLMKEKRIALCSMF